MFTRGTANAEGMDPEMTQIHSVGLHKVHNAHEARPRHAAHKAHGAHAAEPTDTFTPTADPVLAATEPQPQDDEKGRKIKSEYRDLYNQAQQQHADTSGLAALGDGRHQLEDGRTIDIRTLRNGRVRVSTLEGKRVQSTSEVDPNDPQFLRHRARGHGSLNWHGERVSNGAATYRLNRQGEVTKTSNVRTLLLGQATSHSTVHDDGHTTSFVEPTSV